MHTIHTHTQDKAIFIEHDFWRVASHECIWSYTYSESGEILRKKETRRSLKGDRLEEKEYDEHGVLVGGTRSEECAGGSCLDSDTLPRFPFDYSKKEILRDFDALGRLVHTRSFASAEVPDRYDTLNDLFGICTPGTIAVEEESWQDFGDSGQVLHRKRSWRITGCPEGSPAQTAYTVEREEWFAYDEHGSEVHYRCSDGIEARSTWKYDAHGNPTKQRYILTGGLTEGSA